MLNRKYINFNRLSQQGQSRYSDQATGWTVQGSLPGIGERDLFALQNVTHSLSLSACKGSLTGVERPERDFNHSPAHSVEVKNFFLLYLYDQSIPDYKYMYVGSIGHDLKSNIPVNILRAVQLQS